MPRSVSITSAIDKNRVGSSNAWLILLDIEVVDPDTGVVVEVLHVVRNTEEVTYLGNLYVPTDFNIELNEESGAQTTVNLTIQDFTSALQGRMEQYGGGVGFNVTVHVINSENLNSNIPPELTEYFQVVSAFSENYNVSFQLGAENALYVTFPRRRQTRDFCQWRYKDPETCGYSGPLPTCDLSLQGPNGCAAHNNTPNFGAFPGINSNGIRYV